MQKSLILFTLLIIGHLLHAQEKRFVIHSIQHTTYPSKGDTTMTNTEKYFFQYNTSGQIASIDTYKMTHGILCDKMTLNISYNDQKQITNLSGSEIAFLIQSVQFAYDKQLLQQIIINDSVATLNFMYNQNGHLIKYEQRNSENPDQITTYPIQTDQEGLIKTITKDSEKTTYSYSDKINPLHGNSFYFEAIKEAMEVELAFSTYHPLKPITKIEKEDSLYEIEYMYNIENLPISANVYYTPKTNGKVDGKRLRYAHYVFEYLAIDSVISQE